MVRRLGPHLVAQLLANNPSNKVAWARHMVGQFGPGAGYQLNHFLFGDQGNLKDFAGLFALGKHDPGTMGFPHADGSKRTAAAMDEANKYENIAALSLMTDEVRKSTMALGDMVTFLNANFPKVMLQAGAASSAWDVAKHPLATAFAPSVSRGGRAPVVDASTLARAMAGDPF